MRRSENGKYAFRNHVHFLLESVIFIRDVPVLILLLVDVVVVVVVVVGPCTTTNAVATDVVIRNNTEVNRMNIILIIMSWKSCCCSKGICNCEYREVMVRFNIRHDGNDADGWLVAYFVYTQMSCQKSDRWIRWFGLLFSPSRLRGQSEWWFDVLRVYTVDRSTHTTNQLKHVRVVVVGGIEYRSPKKSMNPIQPTQKLNHEYFLITFSYPPQSKNGLSFSTYQSRYHHFHFSRCTRNPA